MGCVCHDPRLSRHVCHNPQTTAAGLRGMGATTPVYRGMCATTPKKGHAARRVLAATRHTATVASITRRRAEQAGRLGDLAKRALSDRVPLSFESGSGDSGNFGARGRAAGTLALIRPTPPLVVRDAWAEVAGE